MSFLASLIELAASGPPLTAEPGGSLRRLIKVYLSLDADGVKSERVVQALEAEGLVGAAELAGASVYELRDALAQAGARASDAVLAVLPRLARFTIEHDLECRELDPDVLVTELCRLKGVSRSAAQHIALHAFGLAVFPMDRRALRVLVRHRAIDPQDDPEAARWAIESACGRDARVLAGVSLLLREVSRTHCKAAKPECADCGLEFTLPPEGPFEPEPGG